MNSFSFSLQQDSLTGLIFVRVEDRSGNIYELKTSLRISVELWQADAFNTMIRDFYRQMN